MGLIRGILGVKGDMRADCRLVVLIEDVNFPQKAGGGGSTCVEATLQTNIGKPNC